MSIKSWFNGLSDMVIRWRVSVVLDMADLEVIERLKARHDAETSQVMRRALAIYVRFALGELPALFIRQADGTHTRWILTQPKTQEFQAVTAWNYTFLVSRQAYARLCRVRHSVGAADFSEVARNALALLQQIEESGGPILFVRDGKGEYVVYPGFC